MPAEKHLAGGGGGGSNFYNLCRRGAMSILMEGHDFFLFGFRGEGGLSKVSTNMRLH